MATITRQEIDADIDEMISAGVPDEKLDKYISALGFDPKDMVHADPKYVPTSEQVWAAKNVKAGSLNVASTGKVLDDVSTITKETTKRMIPNEAQEKELSDSNFPALTYFQQDPGRLDPVLEVGIPLIAQAVTSRLPLGVTAAGLVGSAASGAGTAIVEGRKALMGESKGWRDAGANIVASTVGGFSPSGALAKSAGKASDPIIAGIKATVKGTFLESIAGVSGEVARAAIATGSWADPKQVMLAGSIPAATTMVALPLGTSARRAGERSKEIEQRIATIRETGGYTTPGQAIPTEFSGTEQRMATRDPRMSASELYDKSIDTLRQKLEAKTTGMRPAGEVLSEMSDLMDRPSTYKKQIETLSAAGIAARNRLDDTEYELLSAFKSGDIEEVQKLREVRQVFSDEKLVVDFQEAIDYAESVHKAEALEGVAHKTPVEAMDDAAKAVARTREALVGKDGGYFTSKYKEFEVDKVGWAAHPIIAIAKENMAKITIGLDDSMVSRVKGSLEALESADGVSLTNLRDLDTLISDIYNMKPELKKTSSYRAAAAVQQKIRQEMNDQAPYVLGEEQGKQLIETNRQYHAYKNLEDSPGIEVLLDPKPTGEHIQTLISDLKKNGDGSAYYENVMKYITYMGSLNPEAGRIHLDQFQRAIRSAVMNDARNGSDSLGAAFIDGKKLFETMSSIENAKPGSLRRMGFTKTESIAKLEGLVKKYDDATSLTADDWDKVMRSDAFREAKPELAAFFETGLADKQTRNLITKSSLLGGIGGPEGAYRMYEKAQKTVQQVGGDLKKVEALYDEAINDPILKRIDGGVINDKDMSKLMQLIMYTPGYDKEFTEGLAARIAKGNPENINQIRLYATADLLQRGAEANSPNFSSLVSDVDVEGIAKASRHNRSQKMNEAWERVSPFFTPEQRKGLQDLADEAFDKMIYKRRAGIGAPETAKSLGQVGTIGALTRVVSNAIDNRRYKWAALNLQIGSGLFDYSHRLKVTEAVLSKAELLPAAAKASQRASGRDALRKATTINLEPEPQSQQSTPTQAQPDPTEEEDETDSEEPD